MMYGGSVELGTRPMPMVQGVTPMGRPVGVTGPSAPTMPAQPQLPPWAPLAARNAMLARALRGPSQPAAQGFLPTAARVPIGMGLPPWMAARG